MYVCITLDSKYTSTSIHIYTLSSNNIIEATENSKIYVLLPKWVRYSN